MSQRTRLLAGVEVPDTPIVTGAIELARRHCEPYLFNHSMRSWLFAVVLASQRGATYDPEVLAVSIVLHDIGLTDAFNGTRRFEVEGADAARAFARERGMDARQMQLIWDGVALNSTPSICLYKETEVALCTTGIGVDWGGWGYESIPGPTATAILQMYPHDDGRGRYVASRVSCLGSEGTASSARISHRIMIMSYGFLDVAITPSVRAAQAELGADRIWRNFKGHREFDRFTENEVAFIAERDSFYMASVSETGWPYVQHRGGPPGFLKVVDDKTLAFADYRGNRQYISIGNLAANDRACLFLMDYPGRGRLKIYAHVEKLALDADPALTELVTDVAYKAKLERILRLRLETFDWNCSQHITPRFSEQQVAEAVHPLRERLAQLESENAALRDQLEAHGEQ